MNNDGETNGTGKPSSTQPIRFGQRWCLVSAGLSNVWRFGNLELPAPSGRLLLRGPNGTGKTTALEALIPYLLDLSSGRLSAGKARTTSLTSLMREGAGKRRIGYAWLSFSEPSGVIWSFGVRLNYSESGSPPVKVQPFTVKGQPLKELQLYQNDLGALPPDEFQVKVKACSGEVFEDEDAYVNHVAARLFFSTDKEHLKGLLETLRSVRNPSLLGDISPQHAAEALKATLPTVDEEIIQATADALAESQATRKAFERDQEAADELLKFRDVWSAHAAEVVTRAHETAAEAALELRKHRKTIIKIESDLAAAEADSTRAKEQERMLSDAVAKADNEIKALEKSEEYKASARLDDLKNTAHSKDQAAATSLKALQEAARSENAAAENYIRNLNDLIVDIRQCSADARKADALAESGDNVLFIETRKRPGLRVGETVVNTGEELFIHGAPDDLTTLATMWFKRAGDHSSRAKAADLALVDYKPVEDLEKQVGRKKENHRTAQVEFDEAQQKSVAALAQVKVDQEKFIGSIRAWNNATITVAQELANKHSVLVGNLCEVFWSDEDIDELAQGEASNVLIEADSWVSDVLVRTQNAAANAIVAATREKEQAVELREDARKKRERAGELRTGKLLPFPRPEWAGIGDDSIAFGAAIEWRPEFAEKKEQALLEAALAASGLLSATLTIEGAATERWRVDAAGPVHESSLAKVLCVDCNHERSAQAAAVLSRIALVDSSAVDQECANCGLAFGPDGAFRAGVLNGRVPGADDVALLPEASFIGARQRQAAARAEAERLDLEAADSELRAEQCDQREREFNNAAQTITQFGTRFPSRKELASAEERRSARDQEQLAAQKRVATARGEFETARKAYESAHQEWSARTSARNLPTRPDLLARLSLESDRISNELKRAAGPLKEKLPKRLREFQESYSAEAVGKRLSDAQAEAQQLHETAVAARNQVETLQSTAGAGIEDVLTRLETARNNYESNSKDLIPAKTAASAASEYETRLRQNLENAQKELRERYLPDSTKHFEALRVLLNVNGVRPAVLDGETLGDDTLVEVTGQKLKGRQTYTVRTLMERLESAKAKVAGIWSIDAGEEHGSLITFVLTHKDITYSPFEAADYAQNQRDRAQKALAQAEEKALQDFVIGRLPGAIHKAWLKLRDWVNSVNSKMRSATASSGVGVQVKAPLLPELPPHSRSVYELTCKIGDAERSAEQQLELRAALKSLIDAVPGEEMRLRVAAAVDIRDWVEVYYEITRADGAKRWNSKTGLSGGERRLVVLAPMLAALAAGYDRFGIKSARLAALDEIPAEVDERGREGLARYIAQLDLDLISTSYLWDGCPGAWDGVDAHDLEAGPDGTVVAFPMLIRGMETLPSDSEFVLGKV